MKPDTKKQLEKENLEGTKQSEYSYLDAQAKNFEFSDYVKIRPGPRGLLLSFGKSHPEEEGFIIFKEILLPFEVASSLGNIINDQIKNLIDDGVIGSAEPPKRKDGEEK